MAHVNEANDSSLGAAERDGELPEILVQRDDDLALGKRTGKYFLVARVGIPGACPFDFVAGGGDRVFCARPDAAVEQNLQAAMSVIRGCTLSFPTTRRAYARQASTSSCSSHS